MAPLVMDRQLQRPDYKEACPAYPYRPEAPVRTDGLDVEERDAAKAPSHTLGREFVVDALPEPRQCSAQSEGWINVDVEVPHA